MEGEGGCQSKTWTIKTTDCDIFHEPGSSLKICLLSPSAQPLIFYSSAELLLTGEIEKGKKKNKKRNEVQDPVCN